MLALDTVFMLQVLFESLPISSSGHLALLAQLGIAPILTPLQDFCAHIPTLLIITIYFATDWYKKIANTKYLQTLLFIAIADIVPVLAYVLKIPALFSGLRLYWGFSATCIILLSLTKPPTNAIKNRPSLTDALWVGLAQTAALCIPGLSRLATTYTVLRFCNLSAKNAFSYSWLIQLPLLGAATLKCGYSLLHNQQLTTLLSHLPISTLGLATGGGYILLVLSRMLALNNYFWLFGAYMLAPIIISLLL